MRSISIPGVVISTPVRLTLRLPITLPRFAAFLLVAAAVAVVVIVIVVTVIVIPYAEDAAENAVTRVSSAIASISPTVVVIVISPA